MKLNGNERTILVQTRETLAVAGVQVRIILVDGRAIFGTTVEADETHAIVRPWGCTEPMRIVLDDVRSGLVISIETHAQFRKIATAQRAGDFGQLVKRGPRPATP